MTAIDRRAAVLRTEARAAAVDLEAARVEADRLAKGGPVSPTANAAEPGAGAAAILAGAALSALDCARLAALAADHAGDAAALEGVAPHLAALRVAGR